MRRTAYLACAPSVIAISRFDSNQGDTASKALVRVVDVMPPKGSDRSVLAKSVPDGAVVMGSPDALGARG